MRFVSDCERCYGFPTLKVCSALASKRRPQRVCSISLLLFEPYPPDFDARLNRKRHMLRISSSNHWRDGASENRPPSPGGPATDFRAPSQYDSLPNIARAPGQGSVVGTPPEKRRRDEEGGSSRGKRRGQEHTAAAAAPAAAASPSARRGAQKTGAAGAEGGMDAAELAAKKLLLPFINELSFVEIALAEVGHVLRM